MLIPDPIQRAILNKWFGTARWIYNRCLHEYKKKGGARTAKALRAKVVNDTNYKGEDNQWVLDTPYEIRDQAMKDLLIAFSNGRKFKKRTGKKFEIHYRSKKKPSESIAIRRIMWRGEGILCLSQDLASLTKTGS